MIVKALMLYGSCGVNCQRHVVDEAYFLLALRYHIELAPTFALCLTCLTVGSWDV